MRILITGAAGYIGSIMTSCLLAKGYRVTALDSFMYGQSSLLECCHDPNLSIIRGDVRNVELIARLMKEAEVIFPLACFTGAPVCTKDPEGATSTNLEAIRKM